MKSKPSLEAVIVTYRNLDTLSACLLSLGRLTGTFEVSVAVHENAGDPLVGEIVREVCESINVPSRLYLCESNCGFAAACNHEAAGSNAEFLLFMNPDSELLQWPRGWLPSSGIWGPEVIDDRGRPQRLYGRTRNLTSELSRIFLRRQRTPGGRGYVSGACLLIDNNSFLRLSGFDEHYYMYYEDVDLGLRAGPEGVSVRVNRAWIVRHTGGVSSTDAKRRVLLISAESSVLFHRRHGHRWRLYAQFMALHFVAKSIIAPRQQSADLVAVARHYWELSRERTPEVLAR